jgi:hypothetical protein
MQNVDWIPLGEAASLIGEHPTACYLRIGRRELVGERHRGRWHVTRVSLERLLGAPVGTARVGELSPPAA